LDKAAPSRWTAEPSRTTSTDRSASSGALIPDFGGGLGEAFLHTKSQTTPRHRQAVGRSRSVLALIAYAVAHLSHWSRE